MSPPAAVRALVVPASRLPWRSAWLVLTLVGSVLLVLRDIDGQRVAFETQARIAHRLLSQRAVEHEAILRTLSLTQADASDLLASVYSRILAVRVRPPGNTWPDPALAAAEQSARHPANPVLAQADFARGRFTLLLPARTETDKAYALDLSIPLMVDWSDWPFPGSAETAGVHATLEHGDTRWIIQRVADPAAAVLFRFDFHKPLAASSQPFVLSATRPLGWADLPWMLLLAWAALTVAGMTIAQTLGRHRQAARRSAELLRIGQVARINALGELAAGLAHELNQPLTALIANAQAAQRLLTAPLPDLARARDAMTTTVEQGKRAAEIVRRLRQRIERPGGVTPTPIDLTGIVRAVGALVGPECAREGIRLTVDVSESVLASADPVAVEQILHNLIANARQALSGIVATPEIRIGIRNSGHQAELWVHDNGPGVPASVAAHLFEPFITTRAEAGGLGLGLSLSQTLAQEMGGSLRHVPTRQGSTCFMLTLPHHPPSP